MKKTIAVLVSIIMLLALISGCRAIPNISNIASDAISSALQSAAGGWQGQSGNDDGNKPSTDADSTWAELYENFSSRMDDYYGALDSDESGMGVINMLNGDVDLDMTSSFGSGDETTVTMVFSILGGKNVKYVEDGDTYTVTYEDSKGESRAYRVEYDRASASARITVEQGGAVYSVMSICATDKYCAKSFKGYETGTVSEVVGYDGGNVYLSYESEGPADPADIFKNTGAATDENYGRRFESSIAYEDGKVNVYTAD